MELQWFNKEDFWKQVAAGSKPQTEQDGEFYFQMPLHQIRARIRRVPPEFTPADECDFPGPVERWYGTADGHRFMLTYDYCSPVAHSVTVQHEPGPRAAAAIAAAIDKWRSQNPYERGSTQHSS